MVCGDCNGFGHTIVARVGPECRGLVPDVQEILPDGSVALHYKNGLTALVSFPPCVPCRGRGQPAGALGWPWVAQWARRNGFRFPPIRASRFRGVVWRGGKPYECHTASGTL